MEEMGAYLFAAEDDLAIAKKSLRAALAVLELGCRKFGVVWVEETARLERAAAEALRVLEECKV